MFFDSLILDRNKRLRTLVCFFVLIFWSTEITGQSIAVFESQVKETIQRVETFHVSVARMNTNVAKNRLVSQKRKLYNQLASQLTVPAQYTHLKFPEARTLKPWTVKAKKVAKGLKPNINYQVARGRHDSVICGTESAIDNLYHNVRIIAWYHDELDRNFSSENEDIGALALAGLLDEYLDLLHDALPRVKIRKRGRMNTAGDNKLKYSETQLWRILSVVNRYFFYKIQIHADRKDFYDADFLLMNSMIRTAALFGARPPNSTLTDIDFTFKEGDPGWRGHAYNAINSWEKEVNDDFVYPQNVCAIVVPPKKKPKPKPPAAEKKEPPKDPNAFPPNVDDVKEVAGQIFLKIEGRWKPWSPKK